LKKLKGIEVKSLRNLAKLQFTTKHELLDSYPYGALAVNLKDLKLILSSLGTTSKLVLTLYTNADYKLWTEKLTKNFRLTGIGKGDLFVNTSNQGLFTGKDHITTQM